MKSKRTTPTRQEYTIFVFPTPNMGSGKLVTFMVACLAGQAVYAKDISLKVSSGNGNQSSPLLYGAMFEVCY